MLSSEFSVEKVNQCHNPAGTSTGGQFCGQDYGSILAPTVRDGELDFSEADSILAKLDAIAQDSGRNIKQMEAEYERGWTELRNACGTPEFDEVNAKHTALRKQIYALRGDSRGELNSTFRQAMQKPLDPSYMELNPKIAKMHRPKDLKEWKKGEEWVRANAYLPGEKVGLGYAPKNSNSSYHDTAGYSGRAAEVFTRDAVIMSSKAPVGSFVHETGHFIEHKKPGVIREEVALWYKRAKEPGESLEQTVQRAASSRMYLGKFYDGYSGRIYTTKNKETGAIKVRAMEIVSTGMEQMYANPIGLYFGDREHFRLTLAAMRAKP